MFSDANDVIIPASGETQIDIATASCVLKSGIALGGDLNIIKTTNNGVFLSYYLNSKKKLDIACLAQGISVVHLYSSQLSLLQVKIPTFLEQQKIASFLSAIDDRIQALKKKKSLLEQYKKGVMQKIFSQELRFKDENGNQFPEWEVKTLGEIADFYRGSPISKNDLDINGNYYCIHYGELFTKYTEIISNIISKTNINNGFLSRVGDILMPSSDVTPDGLAKASSIQLDNIILGGDMNILRPNRDYDSNYLSYLINFNKQKIIQIVSGTTVKHIYNKDLKLLVFLISNSLAEQTKIANFLSAIDDKISLVAEAFEATQQYKKGLLQQMFC